MTLFDFNLLSDNEKIELLYEQGTYVGKRKFKSGHVVLYQLESFYVELFYIKYRCYIDKIFCFSSTAFLDPYLEQIDVEILTNIKS